MSRAKTNKLYSQFSRGLITEASPLGFPEGSSSDELNCDILDNGIRTRRRGFKTKQALYSSAGDVRGFSYVWREPGKVQDLSFLVVQVENLVKFWILNEDQDYTAKAFTLDLSTFALAGKGGLVAETPARFASGKGVLYIAHKYLDPLSIEYDPVADSLDVNPIILKVRDFTGLDDSLAVDEEPGTLSSEHHYNLINQGWVNPETTGSGTAVLSATLYGIFNSSTTPSTGPIQDYFTAKSRYPGNNKQWWVAKDTNGDFDPSSLGKIFYGNTRAPRGHLLLAAFDRNYSGVSGISGITSETEDTRPQAVAFSSGRVFYGHRGVIYFSPTLDATYKAGNCFQEADPTAEDISDLIATDGGRIEIPEAEDIVRIEALGGGVLVFATNGIWSLSSGMEGFSALDYSVSLISEIGTESPLSVVAANGQVYWWGRTGIQGVKQSIGQFGPIDGQYEKVNITDDTIKSFYYDISDSSRNNCIGEFDPATNKVYWLYKDADDDDFIYKNVLILDTQNQAFVPWRVGNDLYYLTGLFASPYFSYKTETVEATFMEFTARARKYSTEVLYTHELSLGHFVDLAYQDFVAEQDHNEANGPPILLGNTYESHITTGYEILEDALRRKQAPIVGVFFKREEENIISDGMGGYTLEQPQSCKFQAKWDWTLRATAHKWSTEVESYRPKMTMFVDTAQLEANSADYEVIYSRNKVRGSGRSVQFKFSSSPGKGFTLIGWHVFFEGKTDP